MAEGNTGNIVRVIKLCFKKIVGERLKHSILDLHFSLALFETFKICIYNFKPDVLIYLTSEISKPWRKPVTMDLLVKYDVTINSCINPLRIAVVKEKSVDKRHFTLRVQVYNYPPVYH